MFPPTTGRTPAEIISGPFISDSAGHIHAALSWREYAEKENHPIALLYAGLHLRLSIEHIWFEVFTASSGKSMTAENYRRSVKEATTLYKLIDTQTPHYVKFCEFTKLIANADPNPHPPSVIWDMGRLKRIHGQTSSRLLHFQGAFDGGHFSSEWITEQNCFLKEQGEWVWDIMVKRGNLIVYKPDGLQKPETFALWEDYRDGKVNSESAELRLKLMQPALATRRRS